MLATQCDHPYFPSWTAPGYSNLDGWDDGAKEAIDAGTPAPHAAWNFNGTIWREGHLYCEAVHVHHSCVETIIADNLDALVEEVNNRYGWE